MFTVQCSCSRFRLLHFLGFRFKSDPVVDDNLLTIAPNNQAGDKLHARKVCQASFPASLKITFAPYGRAFSPGRKMGTQMFHGEKLKLNWRTMFSDLF